MINDPDLFNRSLPADFDGQFHWDFLQGVFPRGGMPTDWDAVIEINGFFLVFETKNPGAVMKQGQRRCLETAVRKGYTTVFYVEGKMPETFCKFEIWRCGKHRRIIRDMMPASAESIRSEAKRWVNDVQPWAK